MPEPSVQDTTEANLRRLAEWIEPDRLTEIVDVGANPIEVPVYMPMVAAGTARVTGFEPQPSAFEALKDRESAHERYLPYAVGDGMTGTLNICRDGGFTSLYTPDDLVIDYLNRPRWKRMTRVLERIDIETKRLDDIAEIETLDLLKIDIQGGEVAVFENGSERLSNALAVISEVAFMPIYENQPLLDDQMRALREQGFLLHSFQFVAGASMKEASDLPLRPRLLAKQMIDGDAVFIRDPRRMEVFTDAQLKQFALLALGALRLPDLVARCLKELIRRNVVSDSVFPAFCEMLGGASQR